MRIVVLGAAGQLGRQVVRTLSSRGQCLGLDNRATNRTYESPSDRIPRFAGPATQSVRDFEG